MVDTLASITLAIIFVALLLVAYRQRVQITPNWFMVIFICALVPVLFFALKISEVSTVEFGPFRLERATVEGRRVYERLDDLRAELLSYSESQLWVAVGGCGAGVVEHIVEAGVSPNILDSDARTPLRTSLQCASLSVAAALARGGADPTLSDSTGVTDLMATLEIATRFSWKDARGVLDPLLQRSIPEAIDSNGKSALHYLVSGVTAGLSEDAVHWAGVLERLIRGGHNPNLRDSTGRTPVHLAAQLSERSVVIQRILQNGGKANLRDGQGWTPLMYAVSYEYTLKNVSELLAAGADPNLPIESTDAPAAQNTPHSAGTTPLMIAANACNQDAVRALLSSGAVAAAKDVHGRTAADYARTARQLSRSRHRASCYEQLIELLETHSSR